MQNLLEVITEYKLVVLRRDSVGSSGKSLSSSNTCRIRSYNFETTNTAECFSVQRVCHGYCNLHLLLIRSFMLLITVVVRAFLLLLDLKQLAISPTKSNVL